MRRKLNDYLVRIVETNKCDEFLLQAKSKKEAKEKVIDVLTKASMWDYPDGKYKIECYRVKMLGGGNYEIIGTRKN